MKRPNRYGGSHAQAPQPTRITAIIIISFFIAAVLIGLILLICASHKLAGGNKGTRASSQSNISVFAASFPLGGGKEKSTTPAPRGRGASTTTHILLDEPLEGGGSGLSSNSDNSTATAKKVIAAEAAPQQRDRPAIEVMQNAVVEAQAARERQAKIDAITSYMVQYHGAPGLIALAPLMVDTAEATGMDCRMAPCTAAAESTCGSDPKAHGNLFGCQGGNSNTWPAQIVWYYNRIAFLNSQHGWNSNWEIAYFWYGGGSPYGAGGVGDSAGYADNVIRDLNGIGW